MKSIAVIFDMDGVILDSERVYQEIEREMYEELGIPVTSEEHRKFIGTAESAMWGYMKNRYNFDEEISELIQKERKRFLARLSSNPGIPPMEGIEELLKKLSDRGIPLLIASSSSMEIIEAVIRHLDIARHFSGIVSGDEVEHSKPAPDIFLTASKLINIPPSDCVVIEDSENGVKAARTAGMRVVGLVNPGSGDFDLSQADSVIHGLPEFDIEIFT